LNDQEKGIHRIFLLNDSRKGYPLYFPLERFKKRVSIVFSSWTFLDFIVFEGILSTFRVIIQIKLFAVVCGIIVCNGLFQHNRSAVALDAPKCDLSMLYTFSHLKRRLFCRINI